MNMEDEVRKLNYHVRILTEEFIRLNNGLSAAIFPVLHNWSREATSRFYGLVDRHDKAWFAAKQLGDEETMVSELRTFEMAVLHQFKLTDKELKEIAILLYEAGKYTDFLFAFIQNKKTV